MKTLCNALLRLLPYSDILKLISFQKINLIGISQNRAVLVFKLIKSFYGKIKFPIVAYQTISNESLMDVPVKRLTARFSFFSFEVNLQKLCKHRYL